MMSLSINEWQRVNLSRWAARGVEGDALSQALPLKLFSRLLADVPDSSLVAIDAAANVSVRVFLTPPNPGEAKGAVWLALTAHAELPLTCQRCLKPVRVSLDVYQQVRFVETEAQAEAEDEIAEEDVLALTPEFDLLALVEDELILAVPLVALHGECSPEGYAPAVEEPPEKTNPFAVLAGLKKTL